MDKLCIFFKKKCNIKKDKNIDMYFNVIDDCPYLQQCKSNKKISSSSLYYLIKDVFPNFSQSDKIKFGTGLEKVVNQIISTYTDFKNIKPKNAKGKKEKDSLFMKEKRIIYAEYKSNINLDTEKSKKTIKKCLDIKEELKGKYQGYEIFINLVNFRYLTYNDIPKNIKKKYKELGNHLLGLNDFFELYNLKKFDNYEEYKLFLTKIGNKMFKIES